MAFVKEEVIFTTPGVIQNLTDPTPYRLVYEEAVTYLHYDGDDESSSGLIVDDKLFIVPREQIEVNQEAKTIDFESMENRYIIRPIQQDDSDFFSNDYLKEVQQRGNE